jgi:hypothetical protein
MSSPFHRENLFAPEEARQMRGVVHDLRQVWIIRDPELPFFTLGAAAYLDVPLGPALYERFRQLYNPLLREAFAPLLERVRTCLACHLRGPVDWHPAAALPGFHIFQAHPAFCATGGKIHLDLQYRNLAWDPANPPDEESVVSFTLPVALPQDGGGLNWWDHPSAEEWKTLPPEERTKRTAPGTENYLPYEVGTIVLHSGQILHQIAPGRRFRAEDERISLQGHAIRVGDRFLAYW